MSLALTGSLIAVLCILIVLQRKRAKDRERLEQYSITPEALHTLLITNPEVLIFDVRQPLDLLANSEIIPGAKRIPPKEILENPSLIPKEQDSVVYCTCPSDKTSQVIIERALSLNFLKVKFLKGGLEAWKEKGYPVEPYNESFRLDTGT